MRCSFGRRINPAWDGSADSPILPGEVAYLDVNQLAEGRTYCAAGAIKIKTSPPNAEGKSEFVAYTVNFSGNEVTELFVKNIATGEIVDNDPDLECYGSVQWGADDKTLFYLKMDEQKRPYQLYAVPKNHWQRQTRLALVPGRR